MRTPTVGCLLRCEASWDRATGEDAQLIYMPTWDGGRMVMGTCAYPYCDPTSERMVQQ